MDTIILVPPNIITYSLLTLIETHLIWKFETPQIINPDFALIQIIGLSATNNIQQIASW